MTELLTDRGIQRLNLIALSAKYRNKDARRHASTTALMQHHVSCVEAGLPSAEVLAEIESRAARVRAVAK